MIDDSNAGRLMVEEKDERHAPPAFKAVAPTVRAAEADTERFEEIWNHAETRKLRFWLMQNVYRTISFTSMNIFHKRE
jgi:hypothetical protein